MNGNGGAQRVVGVFSQGPIWEARSPRGASILVMDAVDDLTTPIDVVRFGAGRGRSERGGDLNWRSSARGLVRRHSACGCWNRRSRWSSRGWCGGTRTVSIRPMLVTEGKPATVLVVASTVAGAGRGARAGTGGGGPMPVLLRRHGALASTRTGDPDAGSGRAVDGGDCGCLSRSVNSNT